MNLNSYTPEATTALLARPGKCLLAISEKEKNTFLGDQLLARIQEAVHDFCYIPTDTMDPAQWPQILRDSGCDILIAAWSTGRLPDDLVPATHPLKYVCNLTGAIRDKVPLALIEKGLIVSNWGSSISRTVAECALMLTLMALRRTAHWHEVLHHQGGWTTLLDNDQQKSLFERRVGIHGFGQTAQALVRLLRPFGVQISTYCPYSADDLLDENEVSRAHSLEELFSSNQILIGLTALTSETHKSITEELLRMIPCDGVFVNVSRGKIVDEEALIRVASEGRIRVALDVYASEPLAKDSPLRKMHNIIMMPHQAGPTPDRIRDAGAFALENIIRYMQGLPVEAVIDAAAYDRIT